MLGFARTLRRSADLAPPADRYVEMIDVAAEQMGALLDDLALVARIDAGRWDPVTALVSVEELVREAAERGSTRWCPGGAGGVVRVDPDAAVRALPRSRSRRAATAASSGWSSAPRAATCCQPVAADVAPIVLAEDLRDLGAAVGVASCARSAAR